MSLWRAPECDSFVKESTVQMKNIFKDRKPPDILEYILGIALLLGLMLFVLVKMAHELNDPDIWCHLKTGEYILRNKTIPQTDIFSAPVAGKPWIDHSWFLQVIFYLVFQWGGFDSLLFFSGNILLLAYLFLFFSTYQDKKSLLPNIVILSLAVFASQIRFNIRPENFSVLFFSIYLFILNRYGKTKLVYLLPLVQLLWVNSHGFFIIGPFLIAIYLLLDRRTNPHLKLCLPLVTLVSFINPYGYKGLLYPFMAMLNSFAKSGTFYRSIIELLPVYRIYRLGYPVYPYFLFIIVSILIFIFGRRYINKANLFIWLIFLAGSFNINRNVIYFNFISFVVSTDILRQSLIDKQGNFLKYLYNKKEYFKHIAALAIVIFTFNKIRESLDSSYYIFEENRYKSTLLGIVHNKFPDKATDFLLENGIKGNMFNVFNDGSYITYKCFPHNRVFIDGRTEVYGEGLFQTYQKILNADHSTIRDTFERYNINIVLLGVDLLEREELLRYLSNQAQWHIVYIDAYSCIFLKDSQENKAMVDKFKIDFDKWQVEKADLERIGMEKVTPYPYIRRAWLFYYLGQDELAISEANEALKVLPSASEPYCLRGKIYTKQELYDKAYENLRLASIYGGRSKNVLIAFGEFYTKKQKFKDALKTYKQLVGIHPYFSKGYYLLGVTYNRLNNIRLAVKYLRLALKLDPLNQDYNKKLEEILNTEDSYR